MIKVIIDIKIIIMHIQWLVKKTLVWSKQSFLSNHKNESATYDTLHNSKTNTYQV